MRGGRGQSRRHGLDPRPCAGVIVPPHHGTHPFAGQRWPRSGGIGRSGDVPPGHWRAGPGGGTPVCRRGLEPSVQAQERQLTCREPPFTSANTQKSADGY